MAIGMAISAAMTMAQQRAAQKNQAGMINARNQSNLAEAERQEGYQAQSDQVFGDALAKYEGNEANTRAAEADTKREDALTGAMDEASAPYNPSFGTAGGPQVIKSELARKTAGVITSGKNQAKALAKLGGAKDANFGQLISLGRSGGKLGDVNALSSGSARLLPIEQQTAITNAYNPPSPWLEVGKTVGKGLSSYGGGMSGGMPGTYGTVGRNSGQAMDGSWLIGRSGMLGGGV
jgi:hypothetical protein